MRNVRLIVCVVIASVISACETIPSFDGNAEPSGKNFAAASTIGSQMSRRDVSALSSVFLAAIEKSEAGVAHSWRGPSARGQITPRAFKAGNLLFNPDDLLDFRPGLRLSRAFETDLGEFVLTRNSNVRTGPSTDSAVVEILSSGTGVKVIGRTVGAPWMLVAIDGQILGFVFEDLMVRRPGTELELAGGPTRRPFLCREFDQSVSVRGQTDRWSGVACDKGNGWELLGYEENAPTRLF